MIQRHKKKVAIILACCFLASYLILQTTAQIRGNMVYGETGSFYFSLSGSFGFQHSLNNSVVFTVSSGTFNCSTSRLMLNSRTGVFRFSNLEAVGLRLTFVSGDSLPRLNGENVSINQLSNYVFDVTINSNRLALLTWTFPTESYLDQYLVIGIGLSGAFMMVFSGVWFASAYVKKGLTEFVAERFVYCFLIFLFGFGFFVSWLWYA